MSRRRRAVLLGALALALGSLAASDVSRREAALRRSVGPLASVVVARSAAPGGAELTPARLAVRRIPRRFLTPGTFAAPSELAGARLATGVPAGAFLTDSDLDRGGAGAGAGAGPPVRRGERVADVVAAGSPETIVPGGRVDVLVTREAASGGPGRTTLALEDVEVLTARAAPAAEGGARRVAASLRVTARQAVYLAAAQAFAREVRLLARAPGDHARGLAGTAYGGAG
jgi:pilus assembly protein CpaB